MSGFNLTLPSNASMSVFPNNTMTKFKTKLPKRIELEGEKWYVALTECYIPKTWYTIKNQSILVHNKYGIEEVYPKDGYYDRVEDLLKEITKQFNSLPFPDKPTISYDDITKKVVLNIPPHALVGLSPELALILGFDKADQTNAFNEFYPSQADSVSDITGGLHCVYIYCDIVEQVIVGDSLAPLLKAIPVITQKNFVHCIFENYTYVPIQKKDFDTIQIELYDDFGREIKFESGKLYITLNFIKK